MKSILLVCTAAAVLGLFPGERINAATQFYDLNDDWGDTQNPNGVWTYRAGEYIMHSQLNSPHTPSGQPVWMGQDGYLPIWFKYQGPNYFDIRTGEVYVHSANHDGEGIANILWTSPSDGIIDISGAAWFAADDAGQEGRSSVWSLWLNGLLLTHGEVSWGDPYDWNSPFLFSLGSGGADVLQGIPVLTGDQVILQVKKEFGPYGTFVGINFSVTFGQDSDGDGVLDEFDNCPLTYNPDQLDTDSDGAGDACDTCPFDAGNDADGDGLCAEEDNCPTVFNPDQMDLDNDGIGDACDDCMDVDQDGVCDELDNCPGTYNPDQTDADGDGIGDLCDETVDPISALLQLAETVAAMNLQNGIENSLDSKLDAALNALDDLNTNNDVAACNSLAAFVNAVEAQRGTKLTNLQADELIAAAQEIGTLLNCGN